MPSPRPTRRRVLSAFMASTTSMAGSHKGLLAAAKQMESRDGLRLINPTILRRGPFRDAEHPNGITVGVRGTSPDGSAVVYWWPLPARGVRPPETPFLTVESLSEGTRPIPLEGQGAYLCGISSGAKMIIVRAVSFVELGRKSVLALDLASGIAVRDLTSYLTQFQLQDLERISVSGAGTLAALGSSTTVL